MTLLDPAPTAPAPADTPVGTVVRLDVPWATVLPLAIVLAYADGFWMTSLQSAVGAIERIQDPFTSYWRTSTLLIPLFVVAVLGALTLVLRRVGPQQSTRRMVMTGLLVAAACALAGALVSAGSSAYDYYLQSKQMAMMTSMHSGCDVACLGRQRWMTIFAHGRAVGYTGALLLATNLILTSWIVALQGGRLPVAKARPATAGTTVGRDADLRLLLAGGLVGSAVIHAAVVPEHLQEWAAAGLFFILLTLAQVVVADQLLRRPGSRTVLAAAAVSLLPLVVWLASRTVGLPFGPDAGAAEAVGLADVVACLLEAGTLIAAVTLLRHRARPDRPRLSAHGRALALVALVAATVIGIGGVVPAWVDGGDLTNGQAETPGHHG